jgi:ubiquinol-cytochrome c reductase cytochrome b subunit
MSAAYESLVASFVRGPGWLFVRQMHHWAALLFMAAHRGAHAADFFTGAFRKPREANWVIGFCCSGWRSWPGFTGYSLPTTASPAPVCGSRRRSCCRFPVIGSWAVGGALRRRVPRHVIVGRLYIVHVLLLPAALSRSSPSTGAWCSSEAHPVARARAHRTQRGRRADRAPRTRIKQGGFFMAVFG